MIKESNITFYLTQFDPALLFVLMASLGGLLAVSIGYLVRRLRLKILSSHNEVTGILFLSISTFYSFLLGFVVYLIWTQYYTILLNANTEGSCAKALYREIRYYPDKEVSKDLMQSYLRYVHHVIHDEHPNMAQGKMSRKTVEAFHVLYQKVGQLKPATDYETALATGLSSKLNELSVHRGLRIVAIHSQIPNPVWLPIFIGALFTLLLAALLDIENSLLHMLMLFILGAIIGLFLYILIELDQPYTGKFKIHPTEYKQVLMFNEWANEQSSPPSSADEILFE